MKRYSVSPRRDRRRFRRTALKTKQLNTGRLHMRGGIRL